MGQRADVGASRTSDHHASDDSSACNRRKILRQAAGPLRLQNHPARLPEVQVGATCSQDLLEGRTGRRTAYHRRYSRRHLLHVTALPRLAVYRRVRRRKLQPALPHGGLANSLLLTSTRSTDRPSAIGLRSSSPSVPREARADQRARPRPCRERWFVAEAALARNARLASKEIEAQGRGPSSFAPLTETRRYARGPVPALSLQPLRLKTLGLSRTLKVLKPLSGSPTRRRPLPMTRLLPQFRHDTFRTTMLPTSLESGGSRSDLGL